ncbi:MAG: B12-binding domain-containing radical SAM protein [candidate division Zixibacteria bacterium]|nr:B12-binding domain-containing radical SAM protein [candidate division Zixibacteria bacterium]
MKNVLLIYPEFSPYGFWNYKDVCKMTGAKYPAAPLGLITLAALLPQQWNIRLLDMNTTELHDDDIDNSDLVFVGGMLPQQVNFLRLIDRIHSRGKKVVAGGPDPTSQPEVYSKADYLVLGEAEHSIHPFLTDLENGAEGGIYYPGEDRPDITKSPVPRFDLLNFKDYIMIGVQFSRGCPFNCEFCDIIELYGRTPRTKTPEQIVGEFDALYKLGHRGHIDFVDDNFVGNKTRAKNILRAIKAWLIEHKYPFYFSTEASINLADDEELLQLMADVDMRYVFIGIESTDDEVLKSSQKKQNINRKLEDDLHKIYEYGMIVNGGYIIGFDDETSQSARSIAGAVEYGKICMAMISFLYALPNTQLTRRLEKEGRLFEDQGKIDENNAIIIDQTTTGLNFITKRPRSEIINDLKFVLETVYERKSYFNRCLALGKVLKTSRKYKPSPGKILRVSYSLLKLIGKLGLRPSTAYYFWRNLLVILFTRPSSAEDVANLMAMYIHFRKQTNYIIESMNSMLEKTPKEIIEQVEV